MGCSSCKGKKTMSPMTKKEVEELSKKVEKGVYVFFGLILILALYGIYSLVSVFL
jgi:hypothetical protein